MKCLIIAAGYATRLYPLTENFPKPLLKVGDKAILDWLIEDLDKTALIDEYVVVTNHKFAPIFNDWAGIAGQAGRLPVVAGNDDVCASLPSLTTLPFPSLPTLPFPSLPTLPLASLPT